MTPLFDSLLSLGYSVLTCTIGEIPTAVCALGMTWFLLCPCLLHIVCNVVPQGETDCHVASLLAMTWVFIYAPFSSRPKKPGRNNNQYRHSRQDSYIAVLKEKNVRFRYPKKVLDRLYFLVVEYFYERSIMREGHYTTGSNLILSVLFSKNHCHPERSEGSRIRSRRTSFYWILSLRSGWACVSLHRSMRGNMRPRPLFTHYLLTYSPGSCSLG